MHIIYYFVQRRRSVYVFHTTKRVKKAVKKVRYVFEDIVEHISQLPVRESVICFAIASFVLTISIVEYVMYGLDIGMGGLGVGVMCFIFCSFFVFWCWFIVRAATLIITTLWSFTERLRKQISPAYITLFISSNIALFALLIPAGMVSEALSGVLVLCVAVAVFTTVLFSSIATVLCLFKVKQSKSTTVCLCLAFTMSGLLSAAGLITALWLIGSQGWGIEYETLIRSDHMPQKINENPSTRGNYTVGFLSFGTGTDKRSLYGSDVSIHTPTIDLSSVIKLSYYNTKYFGFTEKNLPLNGVIWYPKEAQYQCPIVIFVHGNHFSTDFSELGYQYLGEMLASQGFIAISVDHNFINIDGFITNPDIGDSYHKVQKFSLDYGFEMTVRAILVLELLKEMRSWNTKDNPLQGRFNLNNIGLVGHSRGGEAIAVVSHFNKLEYMTQFPSIKFDYNFGIKSLFSIAGTDNSFRNMGNKLVLSDINYFAMNGMYDADQSYFVNRAKYSSLQFTDNKTFKSLLYIHRANHGQFNSRWRRYDMIPGISWLQNVLPVISEQDQQQIAKLYMSGFMRATLKGHDQFICMFQDYRSVLPFLPNSTTLFNQYQDGHGTVVADFENQDIRVATTENSTVTTQGLIEWGSIFVAEFGSNCLLMHASDIGNYTITMAPIQASIISIEAARIHGHNEHIHVTLQFSNGSYYSDSIQVLPTLSRELYKLSAAEARIALQTIRIPVHGEITRIMLSITRSVFIIDNIVFYNSLSFVDRSSFASDATMLMSSSSSRSTRVK
jgi:hypothetical protein